VVRNCISGMDHSIGRIRITPKISVAMFLILIGMMIAALSSEIVTPGLERLLGIETIVGKNNVVYLPNGGYAYTNPGAIARWVGSVFAVGVLVCLWGFWIFFRAPKEYTKLSEESS
jgi:protein-S-isoprenylcysteine O-methyltransferase Ste14